MFSNVLLQYGAVFVPLGFAMAIFTLQFAEGWRAIVGLAISLFFFVIGMIAFRDAIKSAREEEKKSAQRFIVLINEIRALREGSTNRGEVNDRDKNNSATKL